MERPDRSHPETYGPYSRSRIAAVMLCLDLLASIPREPLTCCSHGPVAQLGERHTGSVEVRGSSPRGSTSTILNPAAMFGRGETAPPGRMAARNAHRPAIRPRRTESR